MWEYQKQTLDRAGAQIFRIPLPSDNHRSSPVCYEFRTDQFPLTSPVPRCTMRPILLTRVLQVLVLNRSPWGVVPNERREEMKTTTTQISDVHQFQQDGLMADTPCEATQSRRTFLAGTMLTATGILTPNLLAEESAAHKTGAVDLTNSLAVTKVLVQL